MDKKNIPEEIYSSSNTESFRLNIPQDTGSFTDEEYVGIGRVGQYIHSQETNPDADPPAILSGKSKTEARKLERRQIREERRQQKLKNRKSSCVTKLLVVLGLVIISVILSQYVLAGVNDVFALNREKIEVEVTIPKNADLKAVSAILYEAGIIQRPQFFELYSGFTNKSGFFNNGTYILNTTMDYSAIISYLKTNANRIDIIRVTFPEGMTVEDMGARLENNNVCTKAEFIRAVNEGDYSKYSFVNDLQNLSTRYYRLEGYLFPDTYDFYTEMDPERVVRVMLDNFSKKMDDDVLKRLDEMEMSVNDIVTLASIIQFEAANATDMFDVSSVFHNRLNDPENYPYLQSDPTVWYPYKTKEAVLDAYPQAWAGYPRNDVPSEVLAQYDSRYDTYVVKGLPAGPITNPGMDAIRAALEPNSTNYYYFIVDINGKPYYSKTYAEHQQKVEFIKTVKPIVTEEAPPEDE